MKKQITLDTWTSRTLKDRKGKATKTRTIVTENGKEDVRVKVEGIETVQFAEDWIAYKLERNGETYLGQKNKDGWECEVGNLIFRANTKNEAFLQAVEYREEIFIE